MKINEKQIHRLSQMIVDKLIQEKIILFKAPENQVRQRAVALIKADFDRERLLDQEVHKMLDELERQNPGSFQRFKMFVLVKKKLAQEKGIIL